ncbi:MAG: M1 family metallopeptidase [Cryomorphaceae bacterium]|jgi:aminopeptidase N|nr:M1 family metallopeptidase [Cryomorphaceae bacterium]
MKYSLLISLLLVSLAVRAQHPGIDVKEYRVTVGVTDSSDRILVKEWIEIQLDTPNDTVFLDLVAFSENGKGMKVTSVQWEEKEVNYVHKNELLSIPPPRVNSSSLVHLQLFYSGIPEDGLIIGKNKYKQRTFFGDNWPNRAHHWIACNDHPSDKALFSFQVFAPEKYEVVAVGDYRGKESISDGRIMWSYVSLVPIPTKVAVIGVADMVWKEEATVDNIKITSAVYPQNSSKSLADLSVAPKILGFYQDLLGAYEFEKLMNVQSTTRYGGMENAGCIFYDENALNGKGTAESLVAHEIAHQWFGNSVTETGWDHLWLSEGFATYMTNVYIEKTQGSDRFLEQMKMDRALVASFLKKYDHPLVDTKQSDPNRLLNPNAYQKGSWVLHMLRIKLGDSLFFQGLRDYYQAFRLGNADSDDLRNAFEVSSGVDLGSFFENWLHKKGHPIVKTLIDQNNGKKILIVRQTQEDVFQFDLKVAFTLEDGSVRTERFQIVNREDQLELPNYDKKIFSYKLDPDVELLFEEIN